jgi:hypothetical protein
MKSFAKTWFFTCLCCIYNCHCRPAFETKLWPSVGNGHVASVVHSNAVYMNGLYNGNGTTSTRARIPAFISVDILNISVPTSNMIYCLQMDNGKLPRRKYYNHLKTHPLCFSLKGFSNALKLIKHDLRLEVNVEFGIRVIMTRMGAKHAKRKDAVMSYMLITSVFTQRSRSKSTRRIFQYRIVSLRRIRGDIQWCTLEHWDEGVCPQDC